MDTWTDDDVPLLPAAAQLAEDEAIAEARERGDAEALRRIAAARRSRARRAVLYGRLALAGSVVAVLLAVAIVVFTLTAR